MCLYPKLIRNPKYRPNKKNGGHVPPVFDKRVLWVPIGCGKCMECSKQRSSQWQARLHEEIKTNHTGKFVTLTFSDESIAELAKEIPLDGYERDNGIAKLAVRRFLERWRWKNKKSVRHWLVTELGHVNTENVHLHGILFTDNVEDITSQWKYGFVYVGGYVNEKTITYISKYVNKADIQHKEFKPIVLTSAGIGEKYSETYNAQKNKYNETKTKETYTYKSGRESNLPVYYRNKIYTEEEREKLWIKKLDQKIRYVGGSKIDISQGYEKYDQALTYYRKKNQRLGYGDDSENWDKKQYERERRNLLTQKRIDRAEEKKKMREPQKGKNNKDKFFVKNEK